MCSCRACVSMGQEDPVHDNEFQSIRDAAIIGGASAAVVADSSYTNTGRRLQQTNSSDLTTTLKNTMEKLDTVSGKQDSLQGQITSLSTDIQHANQIAQVRLAAQQWHTFVNVCFQ
jgi:peptidoglycan hydrolase CwlO-like protein